MPGPPTSTSLGNKFQPRPPLLLELDYDSNLNSSGMLFRLPFLSRSGSSLLTLLRLLQLFALFLSTVVLFLLASQWQYSRSEATQRSSALSLAVMEGTWDQHDLKEKEKMLPILVPVCARTSLRLYYFEQVLEGLARMDGANETLLVVSVDCPSPPLFDLLDSITTPSNVIVIQHSPPWHGIPGPFISNEYATSANIKFLLTFAFENLKVPTAILLESDLVPSHDFYRYFQSTSSFFFQQTPFSPPVLSIHAFHSPSLPTSPSLTLFSGPFCSWGWSTSSRTWPVLKKSWSWINWDINLRRDFGSGTGEGGMLSLVPERSRVRMVGLQGINVREKEGSDHAREWEGMWMDEGEEGMGEAETEWEIDWRWRRR